MIEGRGPSPYEVLLLVQGLPEDSLTAALMRGGREYFGWTRLNVQLADLFDALNVNTQATGNWRKKPPKFPIYPRPVKDAAPQEKVTVKSLFAQFHGR